MKTRPVGAALFHADRRTDRRTDMTKLIVDFRNFANAPKNWGPKTEGTIERSLKGAEIIPDIPIQEYLPVRWLRNELT